MSGQGLICNWVYLHGGGVICGPLFALVEWLAYLRWDIICGGLTRGYIRYFITKTII